MRYTINEAVTEPTIHFTTRIDKEGSFRLLASKGGEPRVLLIADAAGILYFSENAAQELGLMVL